MILNPALVGNLFTTHTYLFSIQTFKRPLKFYIFLLYFSGGQKELRNYQSELAQIGLTGTNCIICAPTGSGKTMTAGYICRERRRMAVAEGRMYKTLFIVCIRLVIS